MSDIRHPRVLYLKAALFICIGLLASTALMLEQPRIKTALLLMLAIWAFARAYYFAFYVIQHYIDPGYRFVGLLDFARYVFERGRRRAGPQP